MPIARSYYACTVGHTCSVRTRKVVTKYGVRILIVYSTRNALSGKYYTRTGISGVPLRG